MPESRGRRAKSSTTRSTSSTIGSASSVDAAVVDAAEVVRRVPASPPTVPTATQLERAVVGGTVLFSLAAGAMAVAPDTFVSVGVAVSLACFAIGCVTFLLGYARAVPRSRRDELALGGLFFLNQTAPARVQRTFLACLGIEIVVSIAAASARPFTPVAFATLAPLYALGLTTLWGATFGAFPPRGTPGAPPARPSGPAADRRGSRPDRTAVKAKGRNAATRTAGVRKGRGGGGANRPGRPGV